MAKDEKAIEIIINGRSFEISQDEISFSGIVELAGLGSGGGDQLLTVTYRKGGNEHRPEGVMVEGDTIKVKKGTIFNVTATNRS